jgi:nitroimidazol reductase NimA-like FMN-containing flavoprotein (pyridoxamine 5'-phosphate oxidase superfamily)
MGSAEDPDTQAREIVAANRYMVLSTADGDGRPWVSPVWFATADGVEFLWISKPATRHSTNIRGRPEIAIVIFDSSVAPGDARALYLSARAEELDGAERDRCLQVYSAESVAQRLAAFTVRDVSDGGRWRLYRAVATERSVLGPGDERLPVG